MCATESLSRSELIELVRSLESQLASLEVENARLRSLLEEMDGPLDSGSAVGGSAVPSWVRANRRSKAEGEPKARKKREENHARKLEPATEEVVHALETCPDCGRRLTDGWEHRRRQVIDLPAQPYIVRDHIVLRRHCGVCGKDHVPKLDLSGEVVGGRRVSIRIMALVAYLKTECRMPLRSIRKQLQSLHGLSLSVGGLTKLLEDVAARGRVEYESLLEELRSSRVVHADETGWREDGINGYLWAFLTETLRFFVREQSRGSAVALDVLTEGFPGVLVSDFYSGYSPLSCPKQRCWVHLLRDAKALAEAHPENRSIATWRKRIRTLYKKAVGYRQKQLVAESPVPMRVLQERPKMREKFEQALLKLAKPYLKAEEDPRHVLSGRIEKFLFQLFVFLEHPEVPPDNNMAERALRPTVIARKISGGTRSRRGSVTMAILRSLFGTWPLRGLAPLEACQNLLASSNPRP